MKTLLAYLLAWHYFYYDPSAKLTVGISQHYYQSLVGGHYCAFIIKEPPRRFVCVIRRHDKK